MKYRWLSWIALSMMLLICAPIASAEGAPRFIIQGVDDTLKTNIQNRLSESVPSPEHLNDHILSHFIANIPDEVTAALSPYGYFTPETQAVLTPGSSPPEITLTIHPGRRTIYTDVQINILGDGRFDTAFDKLKANFKIKIGEGFDSEAYEEAKQSLFNLAHDRGYRLAKLDEAKVSVNRETFSAQILITFNTGPRFRLGLVHFNQTTFADSFLDRFVRFTFGDDYSPDALMKLQSDLGNSGYFQSVLITPETPDASLLDVPIEVYLTPRKKYHYTFGVGYGTDTQARVSFGWDVRHVTDTGHHLVTLLRASKVEDFWQTSYIIPGKNPATDRYSISAGYERTDAGVGERATKQVGIAQIKQRPVWQQTIALHFLHERSRESSSDPFERSQLLMPSITWVKRKVKEDDVISDGYRIAIDLRGGAEAVFSSTDFFQADLQGERLFALSENFRVIGRGEAGFTIVETFRHLPLSRQFKAGGTHSIRGYPFESIGPDKNILIASIEPQYRIWRNLFLTTFFDAGSVFDDRIDLKRGVGGGFVYATPIGSFSITVAKGLDKDKNKYQLHIGLGPDI